MSDLYLPVVAFLAKLLLEVSQGETVGLHHASIRNLLTTEEISDHQLFRPENTKGFKKAAFLLEGFPLNPIFRISEVILIKDAK